MRTGWRTLSPGKQGLQLQPSWAFVLLRVGLITVLCPTARFLTEYAEGNDEKALTLARSICSRLGRDDMASGHASEPSMSRLAAPVIMAQVYQRQERSGWWRQRTKGSLLRASAFFSYCDVQVVKQDEAKVMETSKLLMSNRPGVCVHACTCASVILLFLMVSGSPQENGYYHALDVLTLLLSYWDKGKLQQHHGTLCHGRARGG